MGLDVDCRAIRHGLPLLPPMIVRSGLLPCALLSGFIRFKIMLYSLRSRQTGMDWVWHDI